MKHNLLNRLARWLLLAGLCIVLAAPQAGLAARLPQENQPEAAVYVVQSGDSLWSIAARFRVSVQDLAGINGLSETSALSVGDQLKIPGLEGIQGVLTTITVPFGENLVSLSRTHRTPLNILAQLNHLSSPGELYAGTTLVILEQSAEAARGSRTTLAAGQSLLELAIMHNASPWDYIQANQLTSGSSLLPGDVVHLPAQDAGPAEPTAPPGPGALPDAIQQVRLEPDPLMQGKAAVLEVAGKPGLTLSGMLVDRKLNFFPQGEGRYLGLQGVHVMLDPGLYTLVISGTLPADAPYFGAPFAFSQAVLVGSGNYPFDPVLIVSPETIDPAVTKPEDAQWFALTSPVTPEKMWEGQFQSPALPPYNDCWPSLFGNRRSYNGSPYTYFHSGLDFCGGVGTDIVAPAAGKVVFAGPLTVRGNATVIDHGWGVYTGYLHQSEILVQVGDMVKPGQLIGKVGGTGRVTGPHLHWEIWVNGVQVDPMDWLEQTYPFAEEEPLS